MKHLGSQATKHILLFEPLQGNSSIIRLLNQETGHKSTVRIGIDDHDFKHRIQQEFPSVIADVIDLAVAIHAADQLTIQDPMQPQIQVKVVLPIRHPELLNQSSLQQHLTQLLDWVTGKKWTFEFVKRSQPGRSIENQRLLGSSDPDVDEVALWSGGLDALAGLYTRQKQSPRKAFALLGSGSNHQNYARQQQVFHGLQDLLPNRRLDLCRVPLRFDESRKAPKNRLSRARGIVFILLGSACAYLRGLKVLHVYENGIGAINLPYRKSAVGLDHSRSVHPETLLRVGRLMSDLIGDNFKVSNPFLFNTKAEMLMLLSEDGQSELVSLTSSCDRPHRKPQQPAQCGYCSSCILRKQALAASQLEDKSYYIVPHGSSPAKDFRLYMYSMLDQVSTLRERLTMSSEAVEQWKELSRRFPELDDIVDRIHTEEEITASEMRRRLIRLFHVYITEWNVVENALEAQFDQKTTPKLVAHESEPPIQQRLLCR